MCYIVETFLRCPLCRRHLQQEYIREKCAEMYAAGRNGTWAGCGERVRTMQRGAMMQNPCDRCPGFAQMYENRSRIAARQEQLREEHAMSTVAREREYRRRRRAEERARRRQGRG